MNARTRAALAVVSAVAVLGALATPALAAPPNRTATPVITAKPTSPTSATTASFSFTSATPGAVFTCQLDGGTATTCVSGVTYSGLKNGAHTFSVKAQKSGLKPSGTATATWTIDTVAPNAPTVNGPTGLTKVTAPVVTFSSSSTDVVAYRCSLDGAAFAACTSGSTVNAPAEGGHQFSVIAIDGVGNQSSPTTIGWAVDTSVKAPFLLSAPPTVTSSTSATFAFLSEDADATLECRLDGGTWTACTSPVTTPAPVGGHSFQVRATDPVGNTALSPLYTWTVGATPISFEWTNQNALPSGVTNSPSATFDFSITGATTVECTFDAEVIDPCSTPVVREGLAEGLHSFAIVVDKGLASETKFSYAWIVDVTAPGKPTISAPSGWVSSTSAQVVVTAAGTSDQLTCTVDGTPTACSTGVPIALSGLSEGQHTVTAAASDKAGNVSLETVSWHVDSLAPVLTVTTPTTLTGVVSVLSDDELTGATGNPVLKTAAGVVVPTTRTCATVEGAALDCSAAVRRIVLKPTAALVPGESYAVVVNENGSTPVADQAGNPAPTASTTFRSPLVQQEDSPAVVQTWRKVSASGAKGGSYVMEARTGARVTWTFTGTSFTFYPVSGPGFGYVSVYVDGVKKGLFNQYASSLKYSSARTIKGLSAGQHRVVVVVTGKKGATRATGAAVGVDAFAVGGVVQKTPALAQSWQRTKSSSALGLYRSVASQKGQTTTMTFSGTGVVWTFQKAADRGKAAVYVDGVLKATVDQYSSSSVSRATWAISGLAAGRHTIRIVALGTKRTASKGTLVSVDALTVR